MGKKLLLFRQGEGRRNTVGYLFLMHSFPDLSATASVKETDHL